MKSVEDGQKRRLDESEERVAALPSFVYFADEQDTVESLLFGGFLVHREKLAEMDLAVAAAKAAVGLGADTPIKWSPPNTASYAAQRELHPDKRRELTETMLGLLGLLEATCFFSLVWKFDKSYSADAYKWAFENVLQRLIITVERKARAKKGVWYPALDVVVDWFPNPHKCKEYFGIYHKAYHEGYRFRTNVLRPLRDFHACPCLLVTSCQFSPALQLADFCVGSVGVLFRWAYARDREPEEISKVVVPVANHFLRVDTKVIGYGLVLPKTGQSRSKVRKALEDLGL